MWHFIHVNGPCHILTIISNGPAGRKRINLQRYEDHSLYHIHNLIPMDKKHLLWPVSRCTHQVPPAMQAQFPVCEETESLAWTILKLYPQCQPGTQLWAGQWMTKYLLKGPDRPWIFLDICPSWPHTKEAQTTRAEKNLSPIFGSLDSLYKKE